MKAHLRNRARARSLTTVVPPQESEAYSQEMAKVAASVLYKSPIPSKSGHAIYILNAAALPDTGDVEYDTLLPYLLARLPGEDDLVSGTEYEVIFFAGSGAETTTLSKKSRPGWGWLIQAYHLLSRAMRKRIQKLYIVHERTWVRLLTEMFSTVVSPKFRRKIVHASSITTLALHIPVEDILIPLSAYLQDRKISPTIFAPYCSGKRAFAAIHPFPRSYDGITRFPRVLRETTKFVLKDASIQTEGVFRLSAAAKVKDILREAYDRGQKFIIWKDRDAVLPLPPYPTAEGLEEIVDEIDSNEAYGVHLAAGLIKLWYTELKEPIVPKSAYRDLVTFFDAGQPTVEQLHDLLSPHSEWSCLPSVSREILSRHLLPLLSELVRHQEQNKMTAENLAVVFAPTFVCGPDQMEDMKISNMLRPIITVAIENWSQLREVFGIDEKTFWKDIEPPASMDDYEDPLYERTITPEKGTTSSSADTIMQSKGIVLQGLDIPDPKPEDNVEVPRKDSTVPPPLPPRSVPQEASPPIPALPPRILTGPTPAMRPPTSDPSIAKSHTADEISNSMSPVRRKPAPPLNVPPPRYTEHAHELSDSPTSMAAPVDGFGPARRGDWSLHSTDVRDSSIRDSSPASLAGRSGSQASTKRKPVGSGDDTFSYKS